MENETKRNKPSPAPPSSSSEPSKSPGRRRNWLELPPEITSSIISRVGAIDILTAVENVCRSWRVICKDPLLWRVIDMRTGSADAPDFNLEKLCRAAVSRSCGKLVEISMEHVSTAELLKYITDSSSGIRRLRFVQCRIGKGLIEVAPKLPLLEELELSICEVSRKHNLLEAIGSCCPLLKSLKLNRDGCCYSTRMYNADASVIARTMPGLQHLQIFGNKLKNDGLVEILDGCPLLESLDLRRCDNLCIRGELAKRLTGKIKNLQLPSDSAEDYEFYNPNPFDVQRTPFELFYNYMYDDDYDYDGIEIPMDRLWWLW